MISNMSVNEWRSSNSKEGNEIKSIILCASGLAGSHI